MSWRFDCPVCKRRYKLAEPPRRRLFQCLTCGKPLRLTFKISARVFALNAQTRN